MPASRSAIGLQAGTKLPHGLQRCKPGSIRYNLQPFWLDLPMAICGIDFGTSNSTCGIHIAGKPLLLPLDDGKPTLPSVLFYDFEAETTLFGRAAINEYVCGTEGRLLRSLKSVLGTALMDADTEIQNQRIGFRQILATFMAELKQRAEVAAGQPLRQAVLGRPVHFVDDDAQADRRAEATLAEIAQSIGFSELAFLPEPIAAAFDYEQQVSREQLVLIVDIGGGTSDFSLIRLAPQRHRLHDRRGDILANAGIHIGGTDFDRLLSLREVMPLLGMGGRMRGKNTEVPANYYHLLSTWHTINFLYERKLRRELDDVLAEVEDRAGFGRLLRIVDERAGHMLAIAVEAAKIGCCVEGHGRLQLDMLEAGLEKTLALEQFEAAVDEAIGKIAGTVASLCADAGVRPGEIATLFVTGGASGVPRLMQAIRTQVPAAQLVEGDRFGSVGTGLALAAQRLFGT